MGTEIAKKNATPQRMKAVLNDLRREDLVRALPESVDADTFAQTAITALFKDNNLQGTTVESFTLACMEGARLGLLPDGTQGVIVNYGGKAVWQTMVQGFTALIARMPNVAGTPTVDVVYDCDEFQVWKDEDGEHLEHRPAMDPDRSEHDVTHAYSVVRFRDADSKSIEYVDREDIEDARAQSESPNSPAWDRFYSEMSKKVCVKRHAKRLDKTPRLQAAVQKDHAQETGEGPTRIRDIDARLAGESVDAVLQRKVEEQTEDIRRRVEEATGESDGPEPVSVSDEDLPPAEGEGAGSVIEEGEEPPEPSEEEVERAEEGRREFYLDWLREMVGADDAPVDREHIRDRAEEEFGDREDVGRTEAGFVDLGELSADDLSELVARVAEERGLSEPGEGEGDG